MSASGHVYSPEPATGILVCRDCFVAVRPSGGWINMAGKVLDVEPSCVAYRTLRWLGLPMVDGTTAGPLTLYHDERRERWFVRVGDPITGQLVTFGVGADIDAKTRAWLAPLAKLAVELDMVQEAM